MAPARHDGARAPRMRRRAGHAHVDPSGGLPYSTHASPGPARAADRTADASA
ncbi:hypothetical protein [Methylobacterium sp. E-016]|uniref:hypothetical protein n=1 Tax=Methylobacterium sp. E-016 TaxID=2836556 RepID=UPI001FBA7134|nr:hypothetical protein [Methylobacterium sp. E-016]